MGELRLFCENIPISSCKLLKVKINLVIFISKLFAHRKCNFFHITSSLISLLSEDECIKGWTFCVWRLLTFTLIGSFCLEVQLPLHYLIESACYIQLCRQSFWEYQICNFDQWISTDLVRWFKVFQFNNDWMINDYSNNRIILEMNAEK